MLEIKLESVEAEDLVGTSLGHMKDLLKDVTVEIDIEPGVPFIRGDSVLLELVLVNLLDNVLKYSRPDGTITIHVSLVEDKVKFSVSDEGPGIPEDDLARIFHKFYRVKAAERGAPGSGLGLSICKAIVELHGGVIGAENRQGGAPGYSSPSLRPPR
jgi:two-component system sensor histidine kinase KdpD